MERKINRRGSIAVESIFSLIIIFMLLSASIDYGVYYHRQATLVKSCSTAAEHLSLYPNEQEVVARVATDSYFANTGQYAEFKIDISGGYVSVDSSSEYSPLFGFIPTPRAHSHKAKVLLREI